MTSCYDRAFSRAVDVVLGDRVAGDWRRRTTAAAHGIVLELGFGTGRNLSFYPPAVGEVLAVDPSVASWELAQPRIEAFARPVRRVAADAAALPLADDSVDVVVSTWTMCSIPDLAGALAEARRVLRPGGTFLFTEHSLSPHSGVARVQRTIQPVWGRLAGGCHVDRDLPRELSAAGWDLASLEQTYALSMLPAKPWTWFVSGAAVPCAA